MSNESDFQALVLHEEDGSVTPFVERLSEADLPPLPGDPGEDVTVAVEHSTLNYKDGMTVRGIGGLVRNYPHVPGIDFAGTVAASASPDYKEGDKVILTGWRVGEATWGGFAGMARVKSGWLVPLPGNLTTRQAMGIGTAGFTAMLAILALEEHGLTPGNKGEVLVTGAAGGVGSIAVALLSGLGYRVAAATGRAELADYLTGLGAASVVAREELEARPKGPLASERWAGAIDSVGGPILGNLLASLAMGASCASVGLAASPKLEATVIPFLLRGVNLLGIDSNLAPKERRLEAWGRLANDLDRGKLEGLISEASLEAIPALAEDILAGKIQGRVVITLGA